MNGTATLGIENEAIGRLESVVNRLQQINVMINSANSTLEETQRKIFGDFPSKQSGGEAVNNSNPEGVLNHIEYMLDSIDGGLDILKNNTTEITKLV